MAAIEQLVRNRLITDPGVTALVGERIQPERLLQDIGYPAIRYTVTDSTPQVVTPAKRILRARLQLDVYATSYGSAKGIVAALRSAINRWGSAADGVIQAFVDDERDVDDAEEKMTRIAVDAVIVYRE